MATKSGKTGQKKQLSPQQEQEIGLLLLGKTDEAIAAEIGVCRQTVNRWQHDDALFIATINQRRAEIWASVSDRFRNLLVLSLDRVFSELEQSDDIDTALAVMKMCKIDPSVIGPVDAAEIEGDRLMHATMVGGRLTLAKLDL